VLGRYPDPRGTGSGILLVTAGASFAAGGLDGASSSISVSEFVAARRFGSGLSGGSLLPISDDERPVSGGVGGDNFSAVVGEGIAMDGIGRGGSSSAGGLKIAAGGKGGGALPVAGAWRGVTGGVTCSSLPVAGSDGVAADGLGNGRSLAGSADIGDVVGGG
jgi:hypothetical protein